MKTALSVFVAVQGCAACFLGAITAFGAPSEASASREGLPNPFFTLCQDTHDSQHRTPAQQAQMVKELGYDGLAHVRLDNLAERLKTVDAAGLKLSLVCAWVSLDPRQPKYDPRLPEAIKSLRGRDTILGVLITGQKPSDPQGDARAVEILREIADLAEAAGIRVALYPHVADWLERFDDAVRIARKVDRKNVGAMFNLCHWMKVEGAKDPQPALKAALPLLRVVTINGADTDGKDWDRLIQPLDRGTFDLFGLLKALKALGYSGPIGLQCYGIAGDAREHLQRSIDAWHRLSARLAAPAEPSAMKSAL